MFFFSELSLSLRKKSVKSIIAVVVSCLRISYASPQSYGSPFTGEGEGQGWSDKVLLATLSHHSYLLVLLHGRQAMRQMLIIKPILTVETAEISYDILAIL